MIWTQLTLADWIWAFIAIVSFMILAVITFTAGVLFLVLGEGWDTLIFVSVAILLWGIWAGIYMAVKARRARI
ncbi:MAG TPA: hypothetical protein VK174_11810 [Chitinophagales bacterium]|nr:hypothetical protein [Chitinophagales bacterium]